MSSEMKLDGQMKKHIRYLASGYGAAQLPSCPLTIVCCCQSKTQPLEIALFGNLLPAVSCMHMTTSSFIGKTFTSLGCICDLFSYFKLQVHGCQLTAKSLLAWMKPQPDFLSQPGSSMSWAVDLIAA